ncbi:MAG: carboxypeptidase regulatory-like domain-containing protein [Candidatus Cloacimonetes bacterium]|nr:carboxypeptidase regulatory-like domain-containing protein [Candidatus Cloacimonadota bacterium]
MRKLFLVILMLSLTIFFLSAQNSSNIELEVEVLSNITNLTNETNNNYSREGIWFGHGGVEILDESRSIMFTHTTGVAGTGGLGVAGGGWYESAHRFSVEQLNSMGVAGLVLTEMQYWANSPASVLERRIRVYTGGSATDSGIMVHEQTLTNVTPGAWNTVVLSTPVAIPTTEELWYSFYSETPPNVNQAHLYDTGPRLNGFGNMRRAAAIAWGGQTSQDGNWLIRGFAVEAGPTGILTGTVTSAGNPVPDVQVSIVGTNHTTMTNALGQYTISPIFVGTYSVTATKFGFITGTNTNISITEDNTTTSNFTLAVSPTVTVSGTVIASDTNAGLAGATVTISGPVIYGPITTSATGAFSIPNVVANYTYTLTIRAVDYVQYLNNNLVVGTAPLDLGNIMIYEFAYPPRNLEAAIMGSSVNLTWQAPYQPEIIDGWLSHVQSNPNFTSIGVNASATMIKAHRYTETQLLNMGAVGQQITEVSFIPRNITAIASTTIQIYSGGSGFPLNPGTMIHSQPGPTPLIDNQWNNVVLSTPITIPQSGELWIAVQYIVTASTPMGCDAGPHIEGFGNVVHHPSWGWTTLYQQGANFTYNWSLRAKVESSSGDFFLRPITYGLEDQLNTVFSSGPDFIVSREYENIELPIFSEGNKSMHTLEFDEQNDENNIRDLTGYNIYRSLVADIENPALWTSIATNLPITTLSYTDPTWGDLTTSSYVYIIQAVYTNNNLSAPVLSNQLLFTPEGHIYVGNPQSTTYTNLNSVLNMNWRNSITQNLYLDHEIPIGGIITHVQYRFRAFGDILDINRLAGAMWMAQVDSNKTEFASTSDWIPLADLNLVWEGLWPLANLTGENDILIELDHPFTYTGGGLVVGVTRELDLGLAIYNNQNQWHVTNNLGSNRTLSRNHDSINLNFGDPGTGTRSANVPNTLFIFNTAGLGHLSGTITSDGNPVPDVQITLNGTNRTVYSNAEGQFLLQYIPQGSNNITATKIGYLDYISPNINIIENQTVNHNIPLILSPTVTVSGVIIASDTDLPLEGANVVLGGYAPFEPVTSNAQGQFSISGVFINRSYSLTINAVGFDQTVHNIEVGDVNLQLGNVLINEIAFPPRNVTYRRTGPTIQIFWEPPNPSQMMLADDRALESYSIYRAIDGLHTDPENWTTIATNISLLTYHDPTWADLEADTIYRYMITAVYTHNNESQAAISDQILFLPSGYVYIGNPTSTTYTGLNILQNFNQRNTLSQNIYHENLIATSGQIKFVQYRFRTPTTGNLIENPLQIQLYMAVIPADKMSFDSSTDWIPGDQFTMVFDGFIPVNNLVGDNDILIELDTPFVYTEGNLVIGSTRTFIENETQYASGHAWHNTLIGNSNRTLSRNHLTQQLVMGDLTAGTRSSNLPNTTLIFSTENMGHLAGKITDASTNAPIEGVEISLLGTTRSTFSNEDGDYQLSYINAGTIGITAFIPGYGTYTNDNIYIHDGETTTLNISLTMGATIEVTGTVISSNTNLPVVGAEIHLSGYTHIGPITTNSLGVFVFSNVFSNQDYTVHLNNLGYQESTYPIATLETNIDLGNLMIWELTYPPTQVVGEIVGDSVHLIWLPPSIPTQRVWLNNVSDNVEEQLDLSYFRFNRQPDRSLTPIDIVEDEIYDYVRVGQENNRQSRIFEGTYNVYRSFRADIDDPALWTTLATNYLPQDPEAPLFIDPAWGSFEDWTSIFYIVQTVFTNNNFSEDALSNRLDKYPENMVYIGDPTSTTRVNDRPIPTSWETGVTQVIFLDEEITMGGFITGIILNHNRVNALTPPNAIYHLWLAQVDKNSFDSGTDWVPYNEFTKVFEGTIPEFATEPGINDIPIHFNMPDSFLYTGGNLVLMGHKTHISPFVSGNNFLHTATPGSNRTLGVVSLSENLNPPFITYPNGTAVANHANIAFFFDTGNMGHVEGIVTGGIPPIPLEGVEITINDSNRTVFTDVDGAYSINYIFAGNISFTATRHGFLDMQVPNILIEDGVTTIRDFEMTPKPSVTINGIIKGSDTLTGLAGANITLEGYDNFSIETDANGLFSLPAVFSGFTYKLVIRREGYVTYVDNDFIVGSSDLDIEITLSEIPFPAVNAHAEIVGTSALVTWDEPDGSGFGQDIWITHAQSETYQDALGISGGLAHVFIPVHRFTQEQLQTLGVVGGNITRVAFHTNDANGVFDIHIYAGGSANPYNPGQLIHTQRVVPLATTFNYFDLDTPVPVPETGELWIGYRAAVSQGHSCSVEAGPVMDGFGNLYQNNAGNWVTLNALGVQFGFMIKAFVEDAPGPIISSILRPENSVLNAISNLEPTNRNSTSINLETFAGNSNLSSMVNSQSFILGNNTTRPENTRSSRIMSERALRNNRALEGYNLYLAPLFTLEDEETWMVIENGITETEFIDENWINVNTGAYRYAVKAVYTNGVQSMPTFTNIVSVNMTSKLQLELYASGGASVEGALVRLVNNLGTEYNDQIYEQIAAGTVVLFPEIWHGTYTLTVTLAPYLTYSNSAFTIMSDIEYGVYLHDGSGDDDDLIFPVRYPEANLINNDRDVFLTWQAPILGNPKGYTILRNSEQIPEITTERYFTDTNVIPGLYTYSVIAVFETDNAPAVSASPIIVPALPPRNLEATLVNETDVFLTWEAALANPTGYKVFREDDPENPLEIGITTLSFTDIEPPSGDRIYYVVATYTPTLDSQRIFVEIYVPPSSDDDLTITILATELTGNFPNPFNPSTTIQFDIKEEGLVRIDIFNIRGQRINTLVNDYMTTGRYKFDWYGVDDNGRDVASGVYFYRMQAEGFTDVKRMLLMK